MTLPEKISANRLSEHIQQENRDDEVCGIILQLPLPPHLVHSALAYSTSCFAETIMPQKDVDGFYPYGSFAPCTPLGIMYILEHEVGNLSGKNALVIGRGKLVGEPMAKRLLAADCTVTVAHSKTKNLDALLKMNDIVISAVGKPHFLDLQKCRAEIVIDVGVNRDANGKLCGDCFNFSDDGSPMKITPVPGGIGLMTRAMLIKNYSIAENLQREFLTQKDLLTRGRHTRGENYPA